MCARCEWVIHEIIINALSEAVEGSCHSPRAPSSLSIGLSTTLPLNSIIYTDVSQNSSHSNLCPYTASQHRTQSIMAASTTEQAVKGGSGTVPTPANNSNGPSSPTRRGSQGGTLFSGLLNQKRNSNDAAAQARRESFNEQKPAANFIGKMWNNFISGNPEK